MIGDEPRPPWPRKEERVRLDYRGEASFRALFGLAPAVSRDVPRDAVTIDVSPPALGMGRFDARPDA